MLTFYNIRLYLTLLDTAADYRGPFRYSFGSGESWAQLDPPDYLFAPPSFADQLLGKDLRGLWGVLFEEISNVAYGLGCVWSWGRSAVHVCAVGHENVAEGHVRALVEEISGVDYLIWLLFQGSEGSFCLKAVLKAVLISICCLQIEIKLDLISISRQCSVRCWVKARSWETCEGRVSPVCCSVFLIRISSRAMAPALKSNDAYDTSPCCSVLLCDVAQFGSVLQPRNLSRAGAPWKNNNPYESSMACFIHLRRCCSVIQCVAVCCSMLFHSSTT